MQSKMPTSSDRSGHIKRPMNAFLVWSQCHRKKMANMLPNSSNNAISKALGELWTLLPTNQKAPYFAKAHTLQKQHEEMYPGWVYQPRKSKKDTATQSNVEKQKQDFVSSYQSCVSSPPFYPSFGGKSRSFILHPTTCSTGSDTSKPFTVVRASQLSASQPEFYQTNIPQHKLHPLHSEMSGSQTSFKEPAVKISHQSQKTSEAEEMPEGQSLSKSRQESIRKEKDPNLGYILPLFNHLSEQRSVWESMSSSLKCARHLLDKDLPEPNRITCDCNFCCCGKNLLRYETIFSNIDNNIILAELLNNQYMSTAEDDGQKKDSGSFLANLVVPYEDPELGLHMLEDLLTSLDSPCTVQQVSVERAG